MIDSTLKVHRKFGAITLKYDKDHSQVIYPSAKKGLAHEVGVFILNAALGYICRESPVKKYSEAN